MKVFAVCDLHDNAISRIADNVIKFAPQNIQFVETEQEADLVVVYAYAHRRRVKYRIENLLNQNKKYAIMQTSVRSTANPLTTDWLEIWENSQLVWSYYDLFALCKEDGNKTNFNFYRAPLGVDSSVFKETKSIRKFIIASTGTGRGWNKESKNETIRAAQSVNKPVFQLGFGENTQNVFYSNGVSDAELAKYYSECEFVSGLRKIEGFELPVIEGLLCGARPIAFDKPHYRDWFLDLAEYIPEDSLISENLVQIFKKGVRSVTTDEKEYVKNNFNWKTIVEGFWNKLLI